jgi:COMPASS component SWD3
LEREKLVGMWREMMKSVTVTAVENNSAGNSEGERGSKGRLVELLKQAGAWQVMNARRRGDGPWTLNRSVLPFSVFLLLREG